LNLQQIDHIAAHVDPAILGDDIEEINDDIEIEPPAAVLQHNHHHVPIQQQQQQQDNLWNPNEWDRVAEDLTWDRVSYLIIKSFLFFFFKSFSSSFSD